MIIKFVDREEELKALRERLNSERFELIIIYGRRRVGKTRLILEAIKGTPHVYYLATEGGNLRHFKATAEKVFPHIKYVKEDWEALLHALKDKVVVIDEFPNLIKENPRIISIFQRAIDLELQNSKTKLVLLGSSVSMIKEKVLSYKSPLYGRRTASLRLRPLSFFSLRDFFPEADTRELVEVYGLTDGIPYYIAQVKLPFWEWLDEEIKSPLTFFRDEVDFLLKYEFSEPTKYRRILEAIAFGKTTLKEIKDFSGLKHSDITPYLRNLIKTDLVKREVPITERLTSKKGRYYLADNFLAFWFRFIGPNLSRIEEGTFSAEEIKESYDSYLGQVFEKVARQFLLRINKQGKLPFKFTRIGKWWHKGEEIDLIALNDKEGKALFVEVKWRDLNLREVEDIIMDLKRKSELTGIKYEKHFGIIARKIKGKEKLELAWDLEDF
ncbi:ATP-binding protein [Pyrococcus kukulkanii]|uniref:ATP-binding protein n=1 Tax=Pyrococcus kukulkanii TaxID=1609559 RepID=UPI003568919A